MDNRIHEQIKEYYGVILGSSDDLKTNACCCSSAPPRYVRDILPLIDEDILNQFYGCGSPIPMGLEGCTALDLGCGTGRDVFILSKLVGENGHVHGVDMTESQLAVARKYQKKQAEKFGYSKVNTSFHLGYIEDLKSIGIEDESVDVVTSNCVINLSPFKEEVFREVYRILKQGGEMYFSDVFSDRRVPKEIQDDPVMRGECMGGAMYLEDFRRLMEKCGFQKYYIVEQTPIQPHDFDVARLVGDTQFYSCTVRAFKCSALEDRDVHYGLYDELAMEVNPERFVGNQAPVTLSDLKKEQERYDVPDIMSQVRGIDELESKEKLTTMQVNVGYGCNLSCTHCFLECGPKRTEMMSKETMDQCLDAFRNGPFEVMDITGGSPEMNPNLDYLIREASKSGQVMVRTNIVILNDEKYAPLIDVYAENNVQIVCSLPYYKKKTVEKQRGSDVFDPTLRILRKLNELGYGKDENRKLTLVYNTDGPYLPPNEIMLEDTYRDVLREEHGIEFTNLIAIGNVPLGRFGRELRNQGKLGSYIRMQSDNFNEDNIPGVMCRDQINVDYDGCLYDCEYYHVLGLKPEGAQHISELVSGEITPRKIHTCALCYSCTARYGSSCGGNLSH